MARTKTYFRKTQERNEKEARAARDALLAESKNDLSLKANAQKNAKKFKG